MSTNVDRTLYGSPVRPPPSRGALTRYLKRVLRRGSTDEAVEVEVRESAATTSAEQAHDAAAVTAAGWRRDF